MKFRPPATIIDEDFRSENTSGSGIRVLIQAVEQEGMEMTGLTSYGGLTSFVQQSSRASTFIISIDDDKFINLGNGKPEPEAVENLRAFVVEVRRHNAGILIFLYGGTRTSRHSPSGVLRELRGFVHTFEDTPGLVTRHIIREVRNYLDSLPPPFFKALIDYAQDSSYSWRCPGHSGDAVLLKSSVRQVFHRLLGENMLRADVCNAVEELGQLLDHTGPVTASERNVVRIFGPGHMLFVTNGTSTSNKMVRYANVVPGGIVVVDRNCHKLNLYTTMVAGVIPVFLMPTRNHFGVIGLTPENEFEPEAIARKTADHPSAGKAKSKKPHILTITQGTYDDALYNAEVIGNMSSTEIDTLHFDEAWLPCTSFHSPYENVYATGHGRPRSRDVLAYATQSTHKLPAGLSQAS